MSKIIEIDLSALLVPLIDQVRRALHTFADENPGTEICTVGLCGDAVNRYIALWADTPDHRDAHVAKWGPKGWIGEDDLGKFCDNCADFAFMITYELQLAGVPDIYDVADDAVLEIRGLDGVVRPLTIEGSTDEDLHRSIAEPLMRAAASQLGSFDMLTTVAPFRVVLQFIALEAFDVLRPTI